MLKKFTLFLLSFCFLALPVFAQSGIDSDAGKIETSYQLETSDQQLSKTPISVFMHPGCTYCKREIAFLKQLKEERDDFEVIYHNIDKESEKALYLRFTSFENLPQVTPITLVGNTIIQGFGSDKTQGKQIIDLLDLSAGEETYTIQEFIAEGGSAKVKTCSEIKEEECSNAQEKLLINIPFFGVTDVAKYSLPTMSVVLGFIDGFNPCAMWVLVTFLVMLMQIGDRRKMFEIAGLFILAETVMYYLILNVWFTAWDFVGMDKIVTPIVGIVSIGGGIFFLYEGFTSDGTCKVTNPKQRAKISTQIRELVSKPLTWVSALGVIGLALSVNIIEFACSVGIPQAFTKILEINNLSTLYQQVLILIYIFFYMIDDFIVFGIALVSIEKLGVTQKYSKYCNLLGGVLMLILGALLIFAPELLKFS